MNAVTLDALRKELTARGFDQTLSSPKGTMVFDEGFLRRVELAELLETLVARREKIFGLVGVIGHETARDGYDDVVCAIEATKAVIGLLELRE